MIGTAPPIRKVLTEASKMVEEGQLKPHVSCVLSIQEIQEAHRLIETRHTRVRSFYKS